MNSFSETFGFILHVSRFGTLRFYRQRPPRGGSQWTSKRALATPVAMEEIEGVLMEARSGVRPEERLRVHAVPAYLLNALVRYLRTEPSLPTSKALRRYTACLLLPESIEREAQWKEVELRAIDRADARAQLRREYPGWSILRLKSDLL